MSAPTIWDTEHFPVLQAAVEGVNKDETLVGIHIRDIAASTGLEPLRVVAALQRLEDAGLVELRLVMPAVAGRVVGVSGQAQQLVGAWPSEETIADRIIAALEAIAENTSDEDERTRTRKILELLAGSGRQIAVGVGTAIITGAVT